MSTKCAIHLTNNHPILAENGQNFLIDTGSHVSFHPSGKLAIGKDEFHVLTSVPLVSTQYLSEKVGCDIHGLIGMDILSQKPTSFSLKEGLMIWDDDADYSDHFKTFPLSKIARGMVAITMTVNGKIVNMIIDSGAPISYIHPKFLSGLECVEIMEDFSPFIGNFQTETFDCEVDTLTGHEIYTQRFGIPPQIVLLTFAQFNVDGIIGIELFKRYRFQIKNQMVYLLPVT